jgi:hypothetical protein
MGTRDLTSAELHIWREHHYDAKALIGTIASLRSTLDSMREVSSFDRTGDAQAACVRGVGYDIASCVTHGSPMFPTSVLCDRIEALGAEPRTEHRDA